MGENLISSQILSHNLTKIIMKIGQVIFKNNLTYKAPLVGSRSNRFWKDLKKFRNRKLY